MQTIFGRFSQISIATAALLGATAGLHAQNFPVTPAQKATATQVAETGVPLSELAPNAPDNYTVKRGDTLSSIAQLFDTTVARIKTMNKLHGNAITVGSRLKIVR